MTGRGRTRWLVVAVAAAVLTTTGAAAPTRGTAADCGWRDEAQRLAASLAGVGDPRAQRLLAALAGQGITADAPQQCPPGGNPSPGPPEPPAPVIGPPGRIAVAADGNQHDIDDWASAPMQLAILARRDLRANLVNYIYDNHIWDSDAAQRATMTGSVLGAVQQFGFDDPVFFDGADQDGLAAGVADLTADINASGPDDELWIVIGGPMETTWMALNGANPEARKHVKCVSHGDGTFNQTHGRTDHGGHDYDDVIGLGCQRVQIPDQNGNLGPTEMSDWDYLLEGGDPALVWLHSRLELAEKGDVSDAGMVFFVVTGNERGSRADLRSYLTGSAVTGSAPK